MQFRVLGALAIMGADGEVIHIGSRVQRALLAVLLVRANEPVSADGLCAVIWPDNPPAHAREGLRVHVHQLRRRIGRERLTHGPAGYQLTVTAEELDSMEFTQLVEQARTLDAPAARGLLRRALALWRGSAYTGIDGVEAVRAEATMLDEKRLTAYEECFEVELALGLHGDISGELRAMASEHPHRERLRSQLMLALYRSDRQAEALAVFEETRRLLADELGVDPGRQLRDMHDRILRDDPALVHRAVGPEAVGSNALAAKSVDAATRPSQLPAAPGNFVGRRSYLDTLDSVANTGEVAGAVVITALAGMAGIGKTALATHWAHLVRDRFPDGQLYVNLRGYAPTPPMRSIEALGLFLRALDVPAERIPIDLDEAAALYRTMLSGRRLLLLLDNARSVDQVRPLLPGSPGCLALVTSRDRLSGLVAHDGAARLTLDVLDADEAVALLRRIIGAEATDREPAAVRALAEACGQLPLALRIAAANLADGLHSSVAAYVAALRHNRSLGSLEVEGDPASSVRAAFTLSYQALISGARRLFRLLSALPGPDISTETAAVLADVAPKEVAGLLEHLARAHLVDQHASGRWAMHDLIRVYATERARDDEAASVLTAARNRLFSHYLARSDSGARLLYPHLVRAPVPDTGTDGFVDSAQASAWLDAERQNLLAAITSGAANGPYDASWRLADTLRGYFYLRSNHLAWLASAEAALEAATAAGNIQGEAAAHLSLGTELTSMAPS